MAFSGWTGAEQMIAGMDEYKRRVRETALKLAEYFAQVIEAYAKENAPWQDESGDARKELFGVAQELSSGVIAIYLSHGRGIPYGKWLEIKQAGKWAVIMPTLYVHYEPVMALLRESLGGNP